MLQPAGVRAWPQASALNHPPPIGNWQTWSCTTVFKPCLSLHILPAVWVFKRLEPLGSSHSAGQVLFRGCSMSSAVHVQILIGNAGSSHKNSLSFWHNPCHLLIIHSFTTYPWTVDACCGQILHLLIRQRLLSAVWMAPLYLLRFFC